MWKRLAVLLCICLMVLVGARLAHQYGPRMALLRILPVPDTVSPQLQALIAIRPGWFQPGPMPKDPAVWRAQAQASGARLAAANPEMERRLNVSVRAERIGGVNCFILTPASIPPENRNRLLIHLHGGGYVLFSGEAALGEAILMAGIGHYTVISVDYRLAPEFPYPAAIDDAIAVWRAALDRAKPTDMAVFGSSSGGAMVLSLVQRAIAEHLPLPAAIAPGTPWADLTSRGDTLATNAYVDNGLVTYNDFLRSAARAYAGPLDLADPRVSPLYGDFHGFPPAILTTGTRDLFLSTTVRTHRKLREAGVEASLQVFEAMSHDQYALDDRIPETREAFGEIAAFFNRHLGQD
jgi:acetyl esterase/lipase